MVVAAWIAVAVIASLIVAQGHYQFTGSGEETGAPPDKCDECRKKKNWFNNLSFAEKLAYAAWELATRAYCRSIGCRWKDI